MAAPDPAPLRVVLCGGSGCAKDRRKAHRALTERLDAADADVVRSRCLGVCSGPVAVVTDERGRAVVVAKARSKGRRKRLVAAVVSGRLPDAADAASVVGTGKRRNRALRRAGRMIGVDLTPR